MGDVLAIGGSILYGLNDVFAEWAIKEVGGVREYLGMVGLFGAIICVVQALILERDQLSLLFGTSGDDIDNYNTEPPTIGLGESSYTKTPTKNQRQRNPKKQRGENTLRHDGKRHRPQIPREQT